MARDRHLGLENGIYHLMTQTVNGEFFFGPKVEDVVIGDVVRNEFALQPAEPAPKGRRIPISHSDFGIFLQIRNYFLIYNNVF